MLKVSSSYAIKGLPMEALADEIYGPVSDEDIRDWLVANTSEGIIITPTSLRNSIRIWKKVIESDRDLNQIAKGRDKK